MLYRGWWRLLPPGVAGRARRRRRTMLSRRYLGVVKEMVVVSQHWMEQYISIHQFAASSGVLGISRGCLASRVYQSIFCKQSANKHTTTSQWLPRPLGHCIPKPPNDQQSEKKSAQTSGPPSSAKHARLKPGTAAMLLLTGNL